MKKLKDKGMLDDEILNIDYHRQELLLAALNKTGEANGAAQLLGISIRTVFRWRNRYSIVRCPVIREYSIKRPTKIPSNASANL